MATLIGAFSVIVQLRRLIFNSSNQGGGDCLDPGPRHPRREEGGAGGGGGQEQLQGDLHPLRLGTQQQGVELLNSILYD